jgi:hypothetical protein
MNVSFAFLYKAVRNNLNTNLFVGQDVFIYFKT